MKTSKLQKRVLSVTIALAILVTSLSAGLSYAVASGSPDPTPPNREVGTESTYDKVDISKLTGEGMNPPELTGSASALGREKEWYEYLIYSQNPVGVYSVNATQRVLFFDPYDYSNALLMSIQGSDGGVLSNFVTANELAFSYTEESTMHMSYSTGTETSTSIEHEISNEQSHSSTDSKSKQTTEGWVKVHQEGKETEVGLEVETGYSWGSSASVAATTGFETGIPGNTASGSVTATIGAETRAFINGKVTGLISNSEVEIEEKNGEKTISDGKETTIGGAETITDKLSRTTGSSQSQSQGWSTSNSTSITTTYNATYFNALGSPLPWRLVNYAVFMPMQYKLQYLVEGDWVTVYTDYCLLTTMQGVCRNWMNNNVSYIEHWGTGEPVVWTEFWSGFFTPSGLKAAYANKLYPDSVS